MVSMKAVNASISRFCQTVQVYPIVSSSHAKRDDHTPENVQSALSLTSLNHKENDASSFLIRNYSNSC